MYVRTAMHLSVAAASLPKAWNTKSACAGIYNRNKFQRGERKTRATSRTVVLLVPCSCTRCAEKKTLEILSLKAIYEGNVIGEAPPVTRAGHVRVLCYRFVYFRVSTNKFKPKSKLVRARVTIHFEKLY